MEHSKRTIAVLFYDSDDIQLVSGDTLHGVVQTTYGAGQVHHG